MDIVFSIFAWVSVVLFQAVVHYAFGRKREQEEALTERPSSSDSSDSEEDDSVREQQILLSKSREEDGEEALDGDEPEEFFELLSQTGSEMASVSTKLEFKST